MDTGTFIIVGIVVAISVFVIKTKNAVIRRNIGNVFDRRLSAIISKTSSGFVYVIAGLVVLNALGIDLGPILTGLGIGSIALVVVAQNTLSNAIAGVYVLSDSRIKKGTKIKIGIEEGIVREVSWRRTTIESEKGTLLVPNSHMVNDIILVVKDVE